MGPTGVDEESWRAALSALLDGEEPPLPMAAIMHHLATCGPCSDWLEQATTGSAPPKKGNGTGPANKKRKSARS